jgi:integrase
MQERLYRRGRVWWCWFYVGKTRVARSTKRTDKGAARLVLRELEREASASGGAAANGDTLEGALRMLIEHGGEDVSQATREMRAVKAGHLFRLMGALELNKITYDHTQGFIDQRLAEGAARTTVRKELSTLAACFHHAVARRRRPEGIPFPIPRFKAKYIPRERYLTQEECGKLLLELGRGEELAKARQLYVLVSVLAGPRAGEIERLQWSDVSADFKRLRLPGTKTNRSRRWVPAPKLLQRVLKETGRGTGVVVPAWLNVRRDLARACRRAGIAPVSPNDLRRTYASWMKQGGADSKAVADLMGHTTTRMVDSVYGQLDELALRRAVELLPSAGSLSRCSNSVADASRSRASAGRKRHPPDSRKALKSGGFMVPRDGIEPSTRGFSILGHDNEKPLLRVVSPPERRNRSNSVAAAGRRGGRG